VLVFALLAAIGIARLGERSRWIATAAALLVVTAAAAYAHPLFTGAVIPTERPLLPSARVTVPPGWQAAAAYVESRPANGKVVVLPRLDYYQTPTTWGYYGASFLHQLIDRPVIEPLPEAYYRDPEVDALVGRLQAEILRGGDDVSGVLQALGARYVVHRRDLDTAFPGRSLVSTDRLAGRLSDRTDLRHLAGFGPADVYEAPGVRTPEVYAAVPLIEDAGSLAGAQSALVPPRRVAAVPADAGDALGEMTAGGAAAASPTRPGGRLAVELERDAVVVRPFESPSAPLLRLPAPQPPFDIHAGPRRFTVRDLPDGSRRLAVIGPAKLGAGSGFFPSEPIELRPSLTNPVGDCNRYDDRSSRDVGIAADVTGARIRLEARDHAACVVIPIRAARPGRPLRLRLSYRTLTGNPARLCVWQVGPDRCADVPPLDQSPTWHRFDEAVTPAAGTESVRLFLYADGIRGGRRLTRTEYRGVRVASAAPEMAVAVAPIIPLPEVSYRRTAPDEFRVRVEGADRPFLLVAAETFAPGWELEASGRDSVDVKHLRVNGYANGWRVPWTGSYELTISYGPERLAEAARTLDLIAVPLGVVALVLIPRRRRARAAGRA
jgi:arabinofuranan 3-O-arabinosyltransferase